MAASSPGLRAAGFHIIYFIADAPGGGVVLLLLRCVSFVLFSGVCCSA